MNGQDYPLDLSFFSPQSQNLARQLAAASAPKPVPVTPVVPTPAPTPIPTPPKPTSNLAPKPKVPETSDLEKSMNGVVQMVVKS